MNYTTKKRRKWSNEIKNFLLERDYGKTPELKGGGGKEKEKGMVAAKDCEARDEKDKRR